LIHQQRFNPTFASGLFILMCIVFVALALFVGKSVLK
jgi:hypothetical protein